MSVVFPMYVYTHKYQIFLINQYVFTILICILKILNGVFIPKAFKLISNKHFNVNFAYQIEGFDQCWARIF